MTSFVCFLMFAFLIPTSLCAFGQVLRKQTLVFLRNQQIANLLLPALKRSGRSAIITYSGTCKRHEPTLQSSIPSRHSRFDATARIRAMFPPENGFTDTTSASGLIQVGQRNQDFKLLREVIAGFKIPLEDAYDPHEALGALWRTPSYQAAEERTKSHSVIALGGLFQMPMKGLSHLPPTVNEQTVQSFLLELTQTFGGLAIYGQCAKPDGTTLYSMEYYQP